MSLYWELSNRIDFDWYFLSLRSQVLVAFWYFIFLPSQDLITAGYFIFLGPQILINPRSSHLLGHQGNFVVAYQTPSHLLPLCHMILNFGLTCTLVVTPGLSSQYHSKFNPAESIPEFILLPWFTSCIQALALSHFDHFPSR